MAMDDIYDVINWILTKLATLVPEAEVAAAREALNNAAAEAFAPAPAPAPAPAATAPRFAAALSPGSDKKQETAHA
jgi:hypothetical protein